MTLLVVIVNYRTTDLTIDCLRSLEGEVAGTGGIRVVVTDNASGDDSVARLEAAVRENGWGGWAAVQPLGRNGGFAFGNNAAIRPALASDDPPRYVLMLNPDTVVRPGAVGALVEFMDGRPDVGIAGSRLEEPDGTPQLSSFRFHTVLSELDRGLRLGMVSRLLARWVGTPRVPSSEGPTDWVAGASMIIRREVFDAIGLLDEGYFMYFEEMDFCARARRAGWPCWYVPRSRVVHLVGQSSGVTNEKAARKRLPGYWFEARRRYFLSNHGRAKTILADLAWMSSYLSYRARRAVMGKAVVDHERLIWDFIRHNFSPVRK
jgi:N-acetylglucosaminyl-diphospho-decaprenol L-rhamnosyltransferase